MESLTETVWDVVLCGTGLQQSLLALALSRSNKKILHVDPNSYYGGAEASLSLQEAESWALAHASPDLSKLFHSASVGKAEGHQISRAYTLSLSPTFIHAKSELIELLVSSKAFRQLEFHAVGSFFIYEGPEDGGDAKLTRIPSTREAVFESSEIPAKAKRSLMKFLRFVFEYDSEDNVGTWKPHADKPLQPFLESEFKLDRKLRAYVVALTLTQSGNISVGDGLVAIHRHMTSMGKWGPGFAALYPRWGGISEIAQVGCRACAVGGGIYALSTRVKDVRHLTDQPKGEAAVEIDLENDEGSICVKARTFVQGNEAGENASTVSRFVAVVKAPLRSLFEVVVEGAPTPVVAVIAFPSGSLRTADGTATSSPVYAIAHSSDTGECPGGQSILHLSTPTTPTSKEILQKALSSILGVLAPGEPPQVLCQLSYEQACRTGSLSVDGPLLTLPPPRLDLAFEDSTLKPIRQAWESIVKVLGEDDPGGYMAFEDREGADAHDDDEYE